MTPEQLDQLSRRLHHIEQQNEEILQLLRRQRPERRSEGPAGESKRSRWNGQHWEMFLEGIGWVPDWGNRSAGPGGAL